MRPAQSSEHIDTDVFFGNQPSLDTTLDHETNEELQDPETARPTTHSTMARTTSALRNTFGLRPSRKSLSRTPVSAMESLEYRQLLSGTTDASEVRYSDEQGTYTLSEETVTEAKKVDLSTLEQGVHAEQWTTTIEGIGKVTMWFEGGTKVDSHGISAVNQPMGGTGWFMRFDDGPVTMLSVGLELEGGIQGHVRIQANGDYVRENGVVKDFALSNSVSIGGRDISLLDSGQRNGRMIVTSLVVETTVTREKRTYVSLNTDTEEEEATDEQAVDSTPTRVEILPNTSASGMTESRGKDWSSIVLQQGVSSTFNPNLQVMSQWWSHGGEYIGLRGTLTFPVPTVANNLRIASATLVLQGTGRLNTTGESTLAMHATGTLDGRYTQSLGSIAYADFIVGTNTIALDPSQLHISNGSLQIGLKTSMDLLNTPPSQSGDNAYSFYLGTVTDEKTAPKLVLTYEKILADASAIDTLSKPWSLEGKNNRVQALTERASALRQAAKELVAMEGSVDTASLQRMAGTLLTSIEDYVSIERQVFAEGLASLSPSMQAELRQSEQELQHIASRIDLLAPNRTRSDASAIIDAFPVPDLGGTISVHGLQGSSISALQQTSQTVEGTGVVTETGRALALDFGSLTSPVLRASFTVTSSLPTDQVRVSFLRDTGVAEEQTVASGSLVTYENASGITGVMIENVTDVLSAEAKAYLEYLRTYRSNYLYSWQDPGPQYHYFVSVRKDLYNRQAEIIAEAKRGEGSHPVSVKDLSVTTNLAETQEASALSTETNALYAKMALPQLTTFPFPYGGFGGVTQVSYDPNVYNVYSLKVFGGAPELSGMTYVDAAGQSRALPREFYSIQGNSITVFPTGQQLQIGISVKNGTGYSPSLPVGQNYDYEVLTKSGKSMAEALPSPEARISFDDIRLMTMNEGPEAGWQSGAALRYDTASPVAVGTLKAQAQITNAGAVAAGFTVKVFSGNTGTSGWDQMQYSYRGTLGGGQSRALITPFIPMTDSQGRSFVRFVVVGDDGRILAEHGRTVGAPGGMMSAEDNRAKFKDFMKNWTDAMERAQADTKAYFASLGQTAPEMGSPSVMAEQIIASNTDTSRMPDPMTTEHGLRLAMRALVSAKESGDATRIAMEQTRFDEAVLAHNAAISVVRATPGARVAESVADVMKREVTESTLHGAALEREHAGLMEGAYRLLVASASTDPNFVGPLLPSSGSKAMTLTNGIRTNPEMLLLAQKTAITRKVIINQKTMASFGIDTPYSRINGRQVTHNLSLSISGERLEKTYTNELGKASGESISLVLEPGEYEVTVIDRTEYMPGQTGITIPVSMDIDIRPFNSAEIIGRISIESSGVTMPVRMRVAEFISDGNGGTKRNTDYKNVSELKTDRPVWVVIPGRNDRDDSAKMIELEKALTQSGYQVVTIDWREAAKSFAGVQGEQWIQEVGDWGFRALVSAGIDGSNIRMGVHSWGSWVGNVIAERYQKENGFGVDTIVAMDSAIDPTLSYYYDASAVNFSNVSKNSVAFWSSGFGSEGRAHTAEHTVELRSPSVSATPIYNQVLKHGMAVTTVANLVRLKNIDPTNAIASRFAWSSNEYDGLPIHEGTDAWMHVDAYREFYQNGSTEEEYIDAIPTRMTFGNPDDEVEDLFLYNEIRNLQ